MHACYQQKGWFSWFRSAKVKQQVIFVLGGPGSGKGTQCERLTKEFSDIAHFSAGDLLREHVKSGTPDGNMVGQRVWLKPW